MGEGETSNGPIRSWLVVDMRTVEARVDVTLQLIGDNLFIFKAAFKGDFVDSHMAVMVEEAVKQKSSGVARSRSLWPFWPFSTRMRLSELDALERWVGEVEYAFLAENVRSGLKTCPR